MYELKKVNIFRFNLPILSCYNKTMKEFLTNNFEQTQSLASE